MSGLCVLMMAVALCAVPGCATRPPVAVDASIEVPADPPAPLEETVPPSPGLTYFWVGGSWVWNDRWVWDPGRWELPPHQGAVWIPHRYVYRDGRHTFIRGGWR